MSHKQKPSLSPWLFLFPGRPTSKSWLTHLYRLWCQAFPLLGRLLHGFTQRLCIFHHCFQLRVCEHPEQVIKEKHQLRCHHIAIFGLKQQGGVRDFNNCNDIHTFFIVHRSCSRNKRCCSETEKLTYLVDVHSTSSERKVVKATNCLLVYRKRKKKRWFSFGWDFFIITFPLTAKNNVTRH